MPTIAALAIRSPVFHASSARARKLARSATAARSSRSRPGGKGTVSHTLRSSDGSASTRASSIAVANAAPKAGTSSIWMRNVSLAPTAAETAT